LRAASERVAPADAETGGSILDAPPLNGSKGHTTRHRLSREVRVFVAACVVYGAMVLLFTLISLFTAPKGSQTGTFRPVATIPSHELLLVLLGLGLGLAISAVRWKPDLTLLVLVPALVVLTDLDHLPSYFGLAQPIRPAHSIIFIVCTVALMATVIRRKDVELASLSAFFAHLSIDTGVFPPFSPVSFHYYDLGEFRAAFLLAAFVFAVAAGLAVRHDRHGAVV